MKHFFTLLFVFSLNVVMAQQWFYEYLCDDYEDVLFYHGDNSAEYDYAAGCYVNKILDECYPIAASFDDNGICEDKVFELGGVNSMFSSVLGLGDGNAFVVAACGDSDTTALNNRLWFAIIDPNMEVVKEKSVCIEEPYVEFSTIAHGLINNDNEIVFVTRVTDEFTQNSYKHYDYVFFKFDFACNLLKQSYLINPTMKSDVTDFVEVANTGCYAVFGDGMDETGMQNVNYIDSDFNHISMVFLEDVNSYPDLILPIRVSVDSWKNEDYFIMSAQTSKTTGVNFWRPIIVKMDKDMNIIDELSLERLDTTDYVSQFRSLSYSDKDKFYVSTHWDNGVANTSTIYLINDKLELLGRKTIGFDENYYGFHSHSTSDGDCFSQGVIRNDNHARTVFYRIKSNDFEMETDVTDEDDVDFDCYPNPVSSVLNIDVDSYLNKKSHIVFVDMLGRRYLDKEVFLDGNVLKVDVSSLDPGTYHYTIIIDDKNVVKNKFVKQ